MTKRDPYGNNTIKLFVVADNFVNNVNILKWYMMLHYWVKLTSFCPFDTIAEIVSRVS